MLMELVISLLQNLDSEKEKELERQARIEASLREREREVQKARSEQTKEIDREREQHKREEAIQNFKALLSDMVYITVLLFSVKYWVLEICYITSLVDILISFKLTLRVVIYKLPIKYFKIEYLALTPVE